MSCLPSKAPVDKFKVCHDCTGGHYWCSLCVDGSEYHGPEKRNTVIHIAKNRAMLNLVENQQVGKI